MRNTARILVVEDETAIARGLADCLRYHGHAVEVVGDGDAAAARIAAETWDLLLLDIMLPGQDGIALCHQARQRDGRQGICMLTAKNGQEDVLSAFAAGADDYVQKPFSVAQLMARVAALLRRAGVTGQDEEQPFTAGPVHIDPPSLSAARDDRRVELVRRDVAILRLLAQEPGRIVSRRLLLREVWGYAQPDRVQTRSVDMHLVKLRRRLQPLVPGDELIETVRGEGYRLGGGLA